MLYNYQFPMRLLRQSSWLLMTGPARVALTQGLISTLSMATSAADANSQGARAAEKPQDATTTEEPEVEPMTVDVPEPGLEPNEELESAEEPEPEPETAEEPRPESAEEPEPEPETAEDSKSQAETDEKTEPKAEPAEEPDPQTEPADEPEPEPADPALSFDDVSWSVEYELADSGHRLLPLLKLSGRVTNASNETLGADALPQLSFMDGREFLSLILDGGEELQPGETKFMSVNRTFPAWDKWSFAFRTGEIKAVLNGLDGIAEAITQEFARMSDGIEDAQKALEQERLSKGFVFDDVVYDVENVEDVDGDSHFMVPMLEISAKVTNTSDEKRDTSDLPQLEFANKSEAFSLDSDFEGGETKAVSLSILFGQNPDECVFSFSEDEDKPAYTGLEGVGEELTKQLADAIGHLSDDQAELEAAIMEEQAELVAEAKLEEEAELEEEAGQEELEDSEEQQSDPEQELELEPEIESEPEVASAPGPDPEAEVASAPGPEPEAEVEPELEPETEVASAPVDEDEPEVELEPGQESNPEPMCWISSAGEKYHLDPNCRYVRGNELKEVSIAEAIAMGRTVCKGCDR